MKMQVACSTASLLSLSGVTYAAAAIAGGASITIPLKHSLLPHLDEVSEAARTIGAVNTVCVMEGGSLYGDNTDWYCFPPSSTLCPTWR